MAFAGAVIVMSGLTILSFIISQLHKIVSIIEKPAVPADKPESAKIPEQFPEDLDTVAGFYTPLVKQLSGTFSLAELYALATENNYPHPHLTLRALREAGILVPQGDGQFFWASTI